MVYVTCSLFAEENAEQISRFLDALNLSPFPLRGRVGRGRRGEVGTLSRPPATLPRKGGGRFKLRDLGAVWREQLGGDAPQGALVPIPGAQGNALQLSPITTHTDGFFIAVLERH